MKNHIILPGLAIIALLAASCTKELDSAQEEQTSTPITITARFGDGGTKVAYSESGNTISATWQDNDIMLVVCNGTVSTLTYASGSGSGTAIFSGSIPGPLSSNTLLTCYIKDINNSSALTVSGNDILFDSGAFLSQNGTLAGAAKCNTYSGTTTYGDGTNLDVAFGVNTSILKFEVTAPAGVTAGTTGATLTYKSSATELAKATFTVGTDGKNTIYLAVPTGQYDGDQTLVYTSGSTEKTRFLSKSHATFAAGHTYSKEISFNNFVDLSAITSGGTQTVADVYTITNGQELTGTLDPNLNVKICIADGATVTLSDVKIITNSARSRAAITCEGNANIILKGKNELVGGSNYPGLQAATDLLGAHGYTLTIDGTGSLKASSSGGGAGIGGSYGSGTGNNVGNITINGGEITATASNGAGIGSGSEGSCQTITINGGTIISESIGMGAGIGAGRDAGCGNIIITGGKITATNSGDGGGGAGIGSGNCSGVAGSCGYISISGGTIIATAGGNGAGIGTGYAYQHNNTCGTITISGMADVTATGRSSGAGIGTGVASYSGSNSCGAIRIKGDKVVATGSNYAAAIGTGTASGDNSSNNCASVEITNGITRVNLKRHSTQEYTSNFIGAGRNYNTSVTECGTITIDGVANATTSSQFENLYSVIDGDTWTLTQK